MSYYLKDKHATQETAIYLCRRINGKMFKYSTGKSVNPKHWDYDGKKILKGAKNYVNINKYLKRLKNKFETLIEELDGAGRLNQNNLRDALDEYIERKRIVKQDMGVKSFKELWRNGWMVSLAIDKAPATVKKKRYALNSLEDFERETKYNLDFDTINETFAEKFKLWALKARKKDGTTRYNSDNSIHKIISITKEFMKWSNRRGYTDCDDYRLISGYNEEYFAPFALDSGDIKILMTLNFNDINLTEYGIRPCNHLKTLNALIKARDAFVFRSLCGIRFSDYQLLNPLRYDENSIKLVTKKTGTSIEVPLQPFAAGLLRKYNYQMPKMANQNENEHLKLLCRIAGFDEDITVTQKRGGKIVEKVKKRWELVSTHTARKTFITNCLRAGIDAYVVMRLVGIKKEATFQRYVQVAKKDVNGAMKKLELLYAS